MARKTLIVVEGQTEQIFVLKFLENLSSYQHLQIQLRELKGGGVEIKTGNGTRGANIEDAKHIIKILNAANDDTVQTYINENLEYFKSQGFGIIYGLRDRYRGNNNKPPLNIEKIEAYYKELEVEHAMTIEMVIAVEEIEAWFLTVPEFFLEYHPSLSLDRINEIFGSDLINTPVETIRHPAAAIGKVLEAVGITYKKRLGDAHKITNILNYNELYLEKIKTNASLNKFVNALNNALA